MKKYFKLLSIFVIAFIMVFAFAACGEKTEAPPPEEDTGTNEPFGITQRPNDLEDYEDLRPNREPFVDTAQPDTGELSDNIFEFESMNASGKSQGLDHLCNSKSFMFSPDFSGYIALEAFDGAVKYTLSITSDKEVRVPIFFRISNAYTGGSPISSAFSVTNNGHEVADLTAIVPTEGDPAEGAPGGYFNMVTVESEISLFEGTNRIAFTCNAGTNVDYVNIRTSAKLVNNTVSSWDIPEFSVKAEPTESSSGLLTVKCTHENCTEQSDKNLPNLQSECYDMEETEEGKVYSINIMGQKIIVATEKKTPVVSDDTGELQDNVFEFENAMIVGRSQNVEHVCAGDSVVFCSDFSGNVCVENIGSGTSFTFVIESDKTVRVPFIFGTNNSYFGNQPLSEAVAITNNGESNVVDLTGIVPENGKTPDLGGISGYFNMVEVPGNIVLYEGENVISVVTKGSINIDYFNIRTSAQLIDKTLPTWTSENVSFEVTGAPTESAKGTMIVSCLIDGCGKYRTADLPVLSYECYTAEADGYYVEFMGRKIKVAELSV